MLKLQSHLYNQQVYQVLNISIVKMKEESRTIAKPIEKSYKHTWNLLSPDNYAGEQETYVHKEPTVRLFIAAHF